MTNPYTLLKSLDEPCTVCGANRDPELRICSGKWALSKNPLRCAEAAGYLQHLHRTCERCGNDDLVRPSFATDDDYAPQEIAFRRQLAEYPAVRAAEQAARPRRRRWWSKSR